MAAISGYALGLVSRSGYGEYGGLKYATKKLNRKLQHCYDRVVINTEEDYAKLKEVEATCEVKHLPLKIRSLEFGSLFNQPVTIPASVTHLTFGWVFN